MENVKKELKIYIKENYVKQERSGFSCRIKNILFEDDEAEEMPVYTSKKVEKPKQNNEVRFSLSTPPKEEKKIYDWADELAYKEKTTNVDTYIKEHIEYTNFQKTLFKFIDERNLKDSDVYNKVHLDRRTFAKIRNEEYHPSKETVILLAFSLELNEKELEDLLSSAYYSLPKNNYHDLIIRFCFINKIYDIKEVNELLDDYNCELFNY
jgi:hypothetical protein